MSAELVNLRRARKAKQRTMEADAAAENRLRFGKSKAERNLAAAIVAREQKLFEGHRRDVRQDDTATAGDPLPSADAPNGR